MTEGEAKVGKKATRNRVIFISAVIIIACSFLYINYLSTVFVEVPYLSAYNYFPMGDKYFAGTLTLGDMRHVISGEHGLLGSCLLFLLNIQFFGYTTLLDLVVYVLALLACGGCIALALGRRMLKEHTIGKEIVYYAFLAMIMADWFAPMQKSISGMDIQVRMGTIFSLLIMLYYDELHYRKDRKTFILLLVWIVIGTNIFGTAYSFAAIPVLCLTVIIRWIKHRKIDTRELIAMIVWAVCSIAYFFEYHLIQFHEANNGTLLNNLFQFITHPVDTFQNIAIYCANFLLGGNPLTYDGLYTVEEYLYIGYGVMAIIILAIVLFFRMKVYRETCLPIYLIGYTFFVWLLTMLGQQWHEGIETWMTNEWYFVHTRFAVIGTLWIYALVFRRIRLLAILPVGILIGSLIFGMELQNTRAHHEKGYFQNMQKYLFVDDVAYMPGGDGESPLRLPVSTSMDLIRFLKEHKLNVYRYYDAYHAMMVDEGKAE